MKFVQFLSNSKLLLILLAYHCCIRANAAKLPTEVNGIDENTTTAPMPFEAEAESLDEMTATALQPVEKQTETSTVSFWNVVHSIWNWIRDDVRESLFVNEKDADDSSVSSATAEGRTFGKIRRLQMALIPIVFKFGVLSAMVAFLVMLGLKTVFLLKILLVMNLLAIFAKFLTLKTNFGEVEHIHSHPPVWGYGGGGGWNPHITSGWAAQGPPPSGHAEPHPSKEIHLHIHGGQVSSGASTSSHSYGSSSGGWDRRNDPYTDNDPYGAENELNNMGPIQFTSNKYHPNHRYNNY